ncbi:caspase family protein [Ancylothrix sp. D3o]|uniref:caspase family protein n=1 Tax=Ancylothrix sp. D3o TaxID=2953691 RepID=UPI0021BB9B15|nr:caspase family protein [Ancylothrix sp. D3o]
MKNYAAIIIGINEYQNFSPLNYAKQDAQALENFLIEEGGFVPDRCLLMTPTSPPIESYSTYPNRSNLLKMIDDLCRHKLQTGDVLWLFFSGYAANWNGEDYLLPVESTPTDIVSTGISLKEIFNLLRSSSAEQLLVLLDIKRPSSINSPIGDSTAKLARNLQIPTIISCKSRQTSSESPIVQQGFFTGALLEALRSNQNITLDNLAEYLSERLPQLCEEHYSHRQDPLIAIAAEHSARNLLPELNQTPASSLWGTSVAASLATAGANTATAEPQRISPPQPTPTPPKPTPALAMTPSAPPPSTPQPAPQAPAKPQPPLWIAGLGVFLLLIFGLYRLMTLADYQARQAGTPTPVAIEPASAPPPPKPTPAPIAPIPVKPTPAPIAPIAVKPPAAKPPAAKPTPAKPAPAKPTPVSGEKLQKPNLELQTAQASQFSDAIAKARTIPKNDPLYPQAQKNIDRWSQVILDIAIGRAQQGAYQSAIKTANLVPKDRKEIYATAQQYIPQWQKKSQLVRTNEQQLIEAQKLVRWGQPSSYSKAIAAASQIKAGQPKYPEAKKLINEWSNNIWQIAQYRANRRLYPSAIAAAQLIPQNTTAYPAAQKALQQWQR